MAAELTGLQDKVAVITGAGRMRSIGRELARVFARAGCDVVITGTGRSPDRYPDDEQAAGWRDIESVADEIRALGRRAVPVVSNVASESDVKALLKRTIDEFGRVDFVINNAAAAKGPDRVPLIDMPYEVWKNVIDVNVNGTYLMSHHFGRRLVEQGYGGAIVNISSVAGKRYTENASAYASSKAAVHAMTGCMAREMGKYQVRINTVCPGTVDTSRMDDVPRGEIWEARVASRIPLNRASDGSDIAYITLFLCSDQGNWIHGQSINVDGGAVVEH